MKFLNISRNIGGTHLLNVDHIVEIEPAVGGYVVTMINGDHHRVEVRQRPSLERSLETIQTNVIPANPGFWVLEYHGQDEYGHNITRNPVIAWRVYPYENSSVEPITVDEQCNPGETIVLYPDGRVVHPSFSEYENEQDWIADCVEKEQAKRAKAEKQQENIS